MNYLKSVKVKMIIMSLTVLIGAVSCEKQDLEPNKKVEKEYAELIINRVDTQNRGGDDDEEAILQGIVKDGDGKTQDNVHIDLVPNGGGNAVAGDVTDSNGEFEMIAPYGTFFFRLIEANGDTTVTNSFQVNGNMNFTIVI